MSWSDKNMTQRNETQMRVSGADKFANVCVGDTVSITRRYMPSERYTVIAVTTKRFVGIEQSHGWRVTFRKNDGRTLGYPYRFAEPGHGVPNRGIKSYLANELRNGAAPAILTNQTIREAAALEGFEIPEFTKPGELRAFAQQLEQHISE